MYFAFFIENKHFETKTFVAARLNEILPLKQLSPKQTQPHKIHQPVTRTSIQTSTSAESYIPFEMSVPTIYTEFNRELSCFCNIFMPHFGHSESKLAFSLFPHCGESGMKTPPWTTG